jgi:hypothetical protein
MNDETMKVELGIWPIFATIGSALWTIGKGVLAVGSGLVKGITGLGAAGSAAGAFSFWSNLGMNIGTTLPAVTGITSLIQGFQQPSSGSLANFPQAINARDLNPQIVQYLQQQQQILQQLHQQELEKEEKMKEIEAQLQARQKFEYFVSKYGIWVVSGGAVLGVILLAKARKK